MPAAATDYFMEATRRFSSTIGSGGVADSSVQTIPMTSVTGLSTATGIELTLDRVNVNGVKTLDKEEVVRGVVNGLNIINTVRGVEGTAQAHAAGAVVEMRLTADMWNRMIAGVTVEHNQNGTHKSALVTSLKASGAEVDTGTEDAKIVTPKAIADSNIAMIADIPVKASGAEVTTGTDDGKFVTPKALADAGIAAGGGSGTDGWNDDTEHTWVYASASTFTIAGVDLTAIFQKGTRLRFKQGGGYKYAVVVASSFSTNTTVTIAVNNDYTIANAAITDNYYSYAVRPQGYPSYFSYTPTLTKPTGMTGTPSIQFSVFQIIGTWCHVKMMWSGSFAGTVTGTSWTMSLPVNGIGIAGSPRYTGVGYAERVGAAITIIYAYSNLANMNLRMYNNAAFANGDQEYDAEMFYPI